VQVRRVHRTHPPFPWFVFFETDATAPPPRASTNAGAVFLCLWSLFFYDVFPLSIEDWCEPILSWQPLIHICPGQAELADETLEVFHVQYRSLTAEFAEKNHAFQ